MEYVLGSLVVVAVLAFVVLPLVRGRRPVPDSLGDGQRTVDPTQERAAIYRELLELELDQKVGKVSEPDFQELSDGLLARAAALISHEDALSTAADADVEREIAEARQALREAAPTMSEETRA